MIASHGITPVQAMIVLMLGACSCSPSSPLEASSPATSRGSSGPRLGVGIVLFSTGVSILVVAIPSMVLLAIGR